MPRQIVSDVVGELLETGKKTGQQLGKLPGEMVKEASQQTGVMPTPKTEEQKQKEAEIERMKEEDEKEKGKKIAFWKKRVAEFQPPPQPPVSVPGQPEKQPGMESLEGERKKELPPPVAAAKRSGRVGSGEFGKRPTG